MLNKESNLKQHIKETESKLSRQNDKEDKWNSIKCKCRARTDHASYQKYSLGLKREEKYQNVRCKQ